MPSGNTNSLNALQQAQAAALTQGGAAINNKFGKTFTPQYYQQIIQNYENEAVPQLTQQYQATANNLNYNLSNRGLTNSSAAQNLGSSLKQNLAQGQEQIVSQAQQAAEQQQQNVAQEEQQLYGQLQVSQNPTQAAQSSANYAAQTPAPSSFAPLGNMFSNWTNLYLSNQAANTAGQNNELSLALFAPYLNQLNQGSGASAIPTG